MGSKALQNILRFASFYSTLANGCVNKIILISFWSSIKTKYCPDDLFIFSPLFSNAIAFFIKFSYPYADNLGSNGKKTILIFQYQRPQGRKRPLLLSSPYFTSIFNFVVL